VNINPTTAIGSKIQGLLRRGYSYLNGHQPPPAHVVATVEAVLVYQTAQIERLEKELGLEPLDTRVPPSLARDDTPPFFKGEDGNLDEAGSPGSTANPIPALDKQAILLFVAAHYANLIRHTLLYKNRCEFRLRSTTVEAGNTAKIVITLDDELRKSVLDILGAEFEVHSKLITTDPDGDDLEEGEGVTTYVFFNSLLK
jgi:hypothetical protein